MKVLELINNFNYEGEITNLNEEITSITLNSKEVEKGSVFFAVKGEKADGNEYISEAFKRGAILVVSENKSEVKNVITVSDVRECVAFAANKYYKSENNVKIIGVVGTNGKTSVTHIIKNVLTAYGKNTGVIGTLGVFYNNRKIEPRLTTPDAVYLNKTIKDMGDGKVEYCVMELSAHAISQKRFYGIKFDVLAYTNCTRDHLDYFKDFLTYSSVKKSVFDNCYAKLAVVNADDDLGGEIILSEKIPVISYALNNPADVFAVDVNTNLKNSRYVVNAFDDIGFVSTKLIGEFNVYNALTAISVCSALGVNLQSSVNAINRCEPISGRLQFVENYNGADIFVDYAHTPDGLKKVLETLRKNCNGNLVVVFGCGGNRDKEKRPLMGEIAGEYADFSIITSDNPRYEEPYAIIKDVERGLRDKSLKYITIQNRYMAIGYAVSRLNGGDVLLIAGKGAETYQEVMGVKLQFNDIEVTRDVISKLYFGGELF